MRFDDESYQIGEGLITTINSGVAWQGTCGNYAAAGISKDKRRKRGGRQVKTQRKLWKGRCTLRRIGILNKGTMTGRGRELAEMIDQRNRYTLQETKWKGVKRGALEVAANYSTMELMEEKWDRHSGEGEAD